MFRFSFLLLICTCLFAEEDISTVSEAIGHLIRKNLDSLGVKFDMDLVIKGIKSEQEPPLSEDECVQALSDFQEKVTQEKSEKNLQKANEFLTHNLTQKDVIELEPSKLQYKVLKQGEGKSVKKNSSPLLRYTGKYLNGTVFGYTEEPEVIALEETLPGFSQAIIGMKEKEKREIYIHPDLGYGKDTMEEPNSLLIFEVEILEIDHNEKPKSNPYISNMSDKLNEAVR